MWRLVLAASLTCSACVTNADVGEGAASGRAKTYVGIVRVRVEELPGALHYTDVKALGLGWDGAAFLGWRSGQWVTADPAKCQLLVVIRSSAEARSAAAVLEKLGENRTCLVDFHERTMPAQPALASPPP